MIKKFGEICGWVGMVSIQSATIPVTLKILNGTSDKIPPIDMVILVWAGLFLFLIRSIVNRDTLYIVSNSTGFALQSVLLALIVFK